MNDKAVKELAQAFKDTHEAHEASLDEKTLRFRLSYDAAAIKAGVDPKIRTLVTTTLMGGFSDPLEWAEKTLGKAFRR